MVQRVPKSENSSQSLNYETPRLVITRRSCNYETSHNYELSRTDIQHTNQMRNSAKGKQNGLLKAHFEKNHCFIKVLATSSHGLT